jgi:hypothetical protein
MAILSEAYFQKRMNAERAIQLLKERFCYIDWEEMTELRQEIYVIEDANDWNESEAIERLDTLLRPYQSYYKKKTSEIGMKT